jgi:alpha-N-arabinofuranosidase
MARVTRCNEGKGWLRRMWVAVGVSAAVIGLTTPASAAADQPVIIVRHERAVTVDGRSVGPVPAGIVGANHRWPNDGLGMWDPTTNSPVDGIDALSRQIGLHTVRHPGGTVANLFDFTKAIGPHNQRGCQTSGGFAVGLFAPTDSRYGPDENEKYVEAIGGETMVMVPTINRTAADAADYVEYMNSPADGVLSNPNGGLDWGDIRAQNGHPSPYGIHIWEFGNEPYLANQRYWRASDTATKVAQFIEGGWQRQTASDPQYADNDGLFLGCDLATRRAGTGEPGQTYRVRFAPIALPGDEHGAAGVGDAPVTEPLLTVAGESWRRVDDLSTQPPEAKVYAIDQAEGLVHFGDGVRGAVPPAGARLSIEYTSGVHEGYLAFRAAMKAVDPTIQVCAGWGKPEFVDAMGSRPYDCLGVHSYSTPPDDGTLTRHGNLQAAAANRDADLKALRQQWKGYFPDGARRPDLMVTEYGTLNVNTPLFTARLSHVLYLADLVASQLENGPPSRRVEQSPESAGKHPGLPAHRPGQDVEPLLHDGRRHHDHQRCHRQPDRPGPSRRLPDATGCQQLLGRHHPSYGAEPRPREHGDRDGAAAPPAQRRSGADLNPEWALGGLLQHPREPRRDHHVGDVRALASWHLEAHIRTAQHYPSGVHRECRQVLDDLTRPRPRGPHPCPGPALPRLSPRTTSRWQWTDGTRT